MTCSANMHVVGTHAEHVSIGAFGRTHALLVLNPYLIIAASAGTSSARILYNTAACYGRCYCATRVGCKWWTLLQAGSVCLGVSLGNATMHRAAYMFEQRECLFLCDPHHSAVTVGGTKYVLASRSSSSPCRMLAYLSRSGVRPHPGCVG